LWHGGNILKNLCGVICGHELLYILVFVLVTLSKKLINIFVLKLIRVVSSLMHARLDKIE
jgi:hypothetical protein